MSSSTENLSFVEDNDHSSKCIKNSPDDNMRHEDFTNSSKSEKDIQKIVLFCRQSHQPDCNCIEVMEKRKVLNEPNNWTVKKQKILKNTNLMARPQDFLSFRYFLIFQELGYVPLKITWDDNDEASTKAKNDLVSSNYEEVVGKLFSLTEAELPDNDPLLKADLFMEYCTFCPNLEQIEFKGTIDMKYYKSYSNFLNLGILRFTVIDFLGFQNELGFISNFPNLEVLHLQCCDIESSLIINIAENCPNIYSLTLLECPDAECSAIAKLINSRSQSLIILELDIYEVCADLMKAIFSCENLVSLALGLACHLSPHLLGELTNLKQMSYINIICKKNSNLMHDDPIQFISECFMPSIEILRLESNLPSFSRKFIESCLQNYPSLTEMLIKGISDEIELEDYIFLPLKSETIVNYEIVYSVHKYNPREETDDIFLREIRNGTEGKCRIYKPLDSVNIGISFYDDTLCYEAPLNATPLYATHLYASLVFDKVYNVSESDTVQIANFVREKMK